MNNMVGKWGYSSDGEHYTGTFDTPEEAMEEAIEMGASEIGQFRETTLPELVFSADDLLGDVVNQDDYLNDWGENWPAATHEQITELTATVRAAFAAWLDKYNLRPTWGMIDDKTIREVSND